MSTTSSTNKPLLTKAKLWAVFFIQLNEAYQITVLLPMVVFMVRGFGIKPKLLGIYTSILNASFCFCQFLCSYAWGSFSDKYGRRKALMSGAIFSTIAILVFGISKDFATALTARCIAGFFNGNLGVMKAYLADITDATNRPYAFSILAISYGFGSVLGAMCGGILIVTHDVDVPWEEYQHATGVLKFWVFEEQFPFLLPCVAGAFISFTALIWIITCVHDERLVYNTIPKKSTDEYNAIMSDLDSMVVSTLQDDNIHCAKSLDQLANFAVMESVAGDGLHNISLISFRTTDEPMEFLLTPLSKQANENKEQYATAWRLVMDTMLKHTLTVYTALVMMFMMYQEMNPVFMAQALNFNSDFIGYSMAFSGVSILLWTYFIQPWFLKVFTFRTMSIVCSIIMAIVMLQMPGIYTVVQEFVFKDEKLTALLLSFLNCMIGICAAAVTFVCVMCWVNNSVPNLYVGRANGLAQSAAALVRAIGPALTGFIWSGTVNEIEHNKIAVYYAYLPSFLLCVGIAIWIYLFLDHDAQLVYEERQLKRQKQSSMFHH